MYICMCVYMCVYECVYMYVYVYIHYLHFYYIKRQSVMTLIAGRSTEDQTGILQ